MPIAQIAENILLILIEGQLNWVPWSMIRLVVVVTFRVRRTSARPTQPIHFCVLFKLFPITHFLTWLFWSDYSIMQGGSGFEVETCWSFSMSNLFLLFYQCSHVISVKVCWSSPISESIAEITSLELVSQFGFGLCSVCYITSFQLITHIVCVTVFRWRAPSRVADLQKR